MIDKEMTIDEIFSKHPTKSQRLAHEMTQAGLHCVGCSASTWETLEAGMFGHGFEEKAIEEMVVKLNAILEEPEDLSTISMSENAAKKFKEITRQDGKEGYALRFGIKPGGCGEFEYILDFSKEPSDDDEVFSSHGVNIHVKKTALDRIQGSTIDYADGLMGSGFKVSNPNAKSSCSCGNSQSF